ncbi:hypothetical protein F2Q65_18095 [Thiohalocapsa marina]|uniref:Uncharacterized protein n=1 Tax=Thiohalocapsa marina TaxID=424902 RepID=A0A5M8FMY9_9GAMM|nr:hypothetical protein [Thiohalocapsa marina]KAA6182302.1 hypothetical protein F2Q65_18095 [Thiohalocapsa marina]
MKTYQTLTATLALLAATTASAQDALVVSLSSQTLDVPEGGQLVWELKLSEPAPAGGLSVLIELTEDSDPAHGDIDYNVAGGKGLEQVEVLRRADGTIEGLRLSIAAGADAAVMLSNVIEDDLQEGPEPATWTLLDGEGYRADASASTVTYQIFDAE